ncbi:MAG: NERD domain-containing protein, partial [Ktedonobacteraceae bacterium]|nr:NERD domain-containing protein [Ktedonobacteraceae bacterium]
TQQGTRPSGAPSTIRQGSVDERNEIGNEAEEYTLQIIKARPEFAFLRSPLLLFPRGGFKEADFLLYTGGVLFCIEVKNWLGSVVYPPRTVASSFGQARQAGGFDTTAMIHRGRPGKNGEAGSERVHKNLLAKTILFIEDLKKYMGRKDPRSFSLQIIPVVAFTHRADISAIRDFQAGIISLAELQDFLNYNIKRINPYGYPPQPWIANMVQHQIPKWDLILTTSNTWKRGVLSGDFVFTSVDGRAYRLPYASINSMVWQGLPGTSYYGPTYKLTVHYMNAAPQVYTIVSGQIYLATIPGEPPQEYNVQQVQHLIVGTANKG